MAMLSNPIEEAERYMRNARKVLSEKAEKEGNFYLDKKYVKAAGNYAWNGVLVALDAVTDVRKNLKKGQRLDFKDGNNNYVIVQESLKQGQSIIDWAAKQYSPQFDVLSDITTKTE